MTDLIDVLRHTGGEHGLRYYFERQLHHFVANIDRLSFKTYPTGNSLLAHLGHPIGHHGHARAVKDRLDDAPMTLPDLPRTGRQAIAQDQRDADWPSRIVNFHKSVRLLDQNF